MVTEKPCSDNGESYEGVFGLCLNLETSLDASNLSDFDGDVQFIHNRLKSMVFKSPDKLREQARRILGESSKIGNSIAMGDQAPMVNKEIVPVVAEVGRREGRPGLGMGRERARFSLKPTSSQLGVGSDPTLNIDGLKDPEAFFKAYEQNDVAKREEHRPKGGVLPDSKMVNSTAMGDQFPMVNNEVQPVVADVSVRERRPGLGLGRKRARFSLNPSSSQLGVGSEPTLNTVGLKDPEAFFKAHEQYDVAKREWHRLKGDVLPGPNQQNATVNKRSRRPGMGLNRSIKYKHLYPSDDTRFCNDVPSSQESFSSSILNPDHHVPRESDQDITSPGASLAGSILEGEQGIDPILDELLSYNCDELDEDRAMNILEERLNLKPIVVEKLNLPDFHDIPKIDFKSPILPKRRQTKSFADLLNGTGVGITSMKHRKGLESSERLVTSPTPSKSPFSSLSLLINRKILHSRSSKDPFSADDIDKEVATSPSNHINKESSDTDDPIEVSKTQNGKFGEGLNVEKSSSHPSGSSRDPFSLDDIDDSSGQSNMQLSDRKRESDRESLLLGKDGAIEVSETRKRKLDECLNVGKSASRLSSLPKDQVLASEIGGEVAVNLSPLFEKENGTEISETRRCRLDEGLNVRKSASRLSISSKDPVSASDIGGELAVNLSLLFEEENADEVSETDKSKSDEGLNVGEIASHLSGIRDANMENAGMRDEIDLDDSHETAKTNENIIQDEVENIVDPSLDDDSVEHTEQIAKGKLIKATSKRRTVDRRKSLAGAGLRWESGVRRSTRIKCRPLEHWNGERLLYGRIHKSLPTVIGLKYASPSAKGDRHKALKVKSFVGGQHKALLDMAAR